MRQLVTLREVARLRVGMRGEDGFTLIELVVAMSILMIVVTALTGALVSATNSEADLNNRFQTQQQARLALAKLTREIHCASQIQQSNGSALSTTAVSGINVTLPAGCPTGGAAAMTVSWCTIVNGSKWDLYRYAVGGCTSGGVRWGSSLTTGTPFSLVAATTGTTQFPLVHVALPVNTRSVGTVGAYQLVGDIAAQNAVRS